MLLDSTDKIPLKLHFMLNFEAQISLYTHTHTLNMLKAMYLCTTKWKPISFMIEINISVMTLPSHNFESYHYASADY